MNRKLIYALILSLILIFTLYEELSLRRYLFQHQDYILAGSLPNFLAPLILSFAFVIIKDLNDSKSIIRAIAGIVAGLILYEFVQLMMPHMVFDVKDIIASILGGLLAYLLIRLINSFVKPKDKSLY